MEPDQCHPKSNFVAQEEFKKTSGSVGKNHKDGRSKGQSLRLMFQDEAHFGRITDPRSCWAPYPIRPVMQKASLVREYVYAYAAVSPLQGDLDWKILCKDEYRMYGEILNQIGKRYTDDLS